MIEAKGGSLNRGAHGVMPVMDRSRRVFVLLLAAIGTAALFFPFAANVSPWDAAVREISDTRRWWQLPVLLLVAPFFLSIPILAWQIRGWVAGRLSRTEIAAFHFLSTAAMTATMLSMLAIVFDELKVRGEAELFGPLGAAVAACAAATLANALLLVRNRRAAGSPEAAAEAFLLGGYLPNGVFCLILCFNEGLQVGAYMILAVSIGYAAAIVLLSIKCAHAVEINEAAETQRSNRGIGIPPAVRQGREQGAA